MATSINNMGVPSSEPRDFEPDNGAAKPMPGPEVAASPSDPRMLRLLYSTMLRTRMIERRVGELAESGKLKPTSALRMGLEATTIGSMIELRSGDAICSEPNIAAALLSGKPFGLMFAEWYGVRSQYLAFAPEAEGTAIHVIPLAATVAAQLNVAAGFALASKVRPSSSVVLVHLPDGFNALGFWHEAATMAAAQRLPMVIVAGRVIEPGQFGDSDLRARATAYGIPGIAVDGNDLVAMWRVAQESIHRARVGAGPTLIDGQLSPYAGSNGSPDASDPLMRMQRYLQKRKLWDDGWKKDLERAIGKEVKDAQAFSPALAK